MGRTGFLTAGKGIILFIPSRPPLMAWVSTHCSLPYHILDPLVVFVPSLLHWSVSALAAAWALVWGLKVSSMRTLVSVQAATGQSRKETCGKGKRQSLIHMFANTLAISILWVISLKKTVSFVLESKSTICHFG